jgi:DedD protein
MEQQKILWIIFSVTFFLAAVVIGGLILLKPGSGRDAAESGLTSDSGARSEISPYDFRDLLNGEEDLPAAPGSEEEGSFDVQEEMLTDSNLEANPELQEAIDNTEIQITSGRELRSSENRVNRNSTADTTAVTEVRKEIQTTRTSNTSRSTAAVTRTQSKPQTRITTDYWIQFASYTKKSSAENTKEALEEKGLTTSIFTKEVDGVTWYRLRNGPYPSRGEAGKFLEWVKNLNGYEGSWITEVQVRR